ncbi:pyruvate kinase [Desulfurispirillum indicum]|uniref:Pyruvate kinase n=1 Tax=Desulfurispirillum indicum (strain ATCC BAA-1389 / DSM 22839 / S5) TaxID=653733 RepID=E6W3W5_DESIS|nr:pyruvate kinase [Desulfurispirillum indicum]ADU65833.1 pyruvate kinase [Desulfurispirillum indicum S5]UCZ57768.1 pyruvate kinase [Desulfurispirillum indicum]
MRKTKIVATIGPASNSKEAITSLIRAGLSVARLNFSHGTHSDHAEVIRTIREVSTEMGIPVAILQDLQGPKMRTGKLRDATPVELRVGQTFTITIDDIIGDNEQVSTTYTPLPRDVKKGDRILLSDGLIELRVISADDRSVQTEVLNGGTLAEKQGINLPGVQVSIPAITEKDYEDLCFGLEQEVDYIALSFVRSATDVQELKTIIAGKGKNTPIIAKIEKPEAVDRMEEILSIADGIMVARGDLGVELPPEQVPLIQKRIIHMANARAIPVITATQMLESMINNPRPTRAEASDVANAILDGSDAVMLSGETARGKYPVDAVRMMARIATEVERGMLQDHALRLEAMNFADVDAVPHAVGGAIEAISNRLPIKAVWVYTQKGGTARLASRHRPRIPVLAFTPHVSLYRRLSLLWGIHPVLIEPVHSIEELMESARRISEYRGVVKTGDKVIITSSYPFEHHGESNFLQIITLD